MTGEYAHARIHLSAFDPFHLHNKVPHDGIYDPLFSLSTTELMLNLDSFQLLLLLLLLLLPSLGSRDATLSGRDEELG